MVVSGELALSLDVSAGSAKSLEDTSNVSSLLHGDDSKLILLIYPDQEGLGIVVEDASARWPVSVETASSEESVSFPMKK